MEFQHAQAQAASRTAQTAAAADAKVATAKPKVGRNEPCTCGSGKKYKHCCGKLA